MLLFTIIIITMYKYTYQLSQSYRTDTSSKYQSSQLYPSDKINNIHCQSLSNGFKYDRSHLNGQSKRQTSLSQNDRRNQAKERKYSQFQTNYNQRVNQGKELMSHGKSSLINKENKLQEISQKYGHRSFLIPQNLENDNKITFSSNAYNQYKEQKKSKSINFKPQQRSIIHQRPLQDKVNTLSYYPLKATQIFVNKKVGLEAEQDVNRTKVKTEISQYLQKKRKREQEITKQKKYNYIPKEEAARPNPSYDTSSKSQHNEAVAKLSSLQQKIQSTIGSYISY